MATGRGGQGDDDDYGVVDGSPADLFENQLIADAAPFRHRPIAAGPGRPKGSANKRTLDMRDLYLRSGYPHPLLWQGAMLKQGVDGLAAMLNCDLVEAADLLRKIAADAAPYIESKMPSKVDLGDGKLPVLAVFDAGDALRQIHQARQDGTMGIDDDLAPALIEHERNQQLSEAEPEHSHAERSHTEGEAAD